MSTLDYKLLDAIKTMSGDDIKEHELEEDKLINKDSSDNEILDYIMIFLCSRFTRNRNFYKGGYTRMKLIPDYSRYSHDIDFSISKEDEYEDIKCVFKELGQDLLSKGIIIDYKIKDDISPTKSGGVDFYRDCNHKKLGIDVGCHDVSFGITDWEILGFTESRFTAERMLSDKLSAIFSRKRFRRPKDLYDVYIIRDNFDIDYNLLADCIDKRDSMDWESHPFKEEILIQYAKAYDSLTIGNPAVVVKPSFRDCLSTLSYIVGQLKRLNRYEELTHIDW